MRNKVAIFGLLALLIPCLEAHADLASATALFKKGNESYEEGKFDEAIEEYENILNLGVKNFRVFYNLGNAYFRQNELGKSILNYRRALVLEPRDEDAQANLSFAKLFTLDKVEERKINPLSNMLHSFLDLWSVDEFAMLASSFYTLTMALGILMLFKGSKRYVKMGFVAFLILMVVLGSSLFAKVYFESLDYGVVVVPEAEVRSGPGDDYMLQFNGHEGLEFRVDEEAEGWYRISLPNGTRGWIPVEAVEII
ncbi:MAG: tetratricopeptide repeat protein [candidate division Zixibacteria bacterium]|nr:tetratricopeptide repeat protein [candidate division Zixibacteria bacterium]